MRTTQVLVGEVLHDSSKDPKGLGNWDGTTDLTPYIDWASSIISTVIVKAANRAAGPVGIDPVTAELMERWLAAYGYCKMDPIYQSKSTGGASGNFVRGQDPQDYKVAAIELDPSGMLKAQLARQTAGGAWLGKTPTEQIPVELRS